MKIIFILFYFLSNTKKKTLGATFPLRQWEINFSFFATTNCLAFEGGVASVRESGIVVVGVEEGVIVFGVEEHPKKNNWDGYLFFILLYIFSVSTSSYFVFCSDVDVVVDDYFFWNS